MRLLARCVAAVLVLGVIALVIMGAIAQGGVATTPNTLMPEEALYQTQPIYVTETPADEGAVSATDEGLSTSGMRPR